MLVLMISFIFLPGALFQFQIKDEIKAARIEATKAYK